MWKDEFVSAMATFQKSMIEMHSKRTADMISEITKVLGTRNEAGSTEEDVPNRPSAEQPAATDVAVPSNQSSGGTDVAGAEILVDMQQLHIGTSYEDHEDIPYGGDTCDAPSFRLFNEDDPEFMSTQEMVESIHSETAYPSPAHVSSPAATRPPPLASAPSLGASRSPSPASVPSVVPSRSPLPAAPSPGAARSPSPAAPTPVAARSPSPAAATPTAARSPSPAATSPPVGDSSGPSTHDLKNRKKRAHKEVDEDDAAEAKKIRINIDVEEKYKRCILINIPKRRGRKGKSTDAPPPFLKTSGGFYVSLEHFHDSMCPRGQMCNEVMACWIEMFNNECKEDSKTSLITKYVASPVLTGQLINDPETFMTQSCLKLLETINKADKLAKVDLIFFPILKEQHWVLTCINNLRKQINYFDPIDDGKESLWSKLSQNLLINLKKVASEAKIGLKDISLYQRIPLASIHGRQICLTAAFSA